MHKEYYTTWTNELVIDCDDPECQECCPHDEHDHGICLDCEKDLTDDLAGAAEYAFEGDR